MAEEVGEAGVATGRTIREVALLTSLSVIALVVLRGLQCWSLGPLLYSNEFAQLGSLAYDLAHGQLDASLGFRDLYAIYAYGDQAQGTFWVAVLAVPLSWLLGPSTAALHGVAIGSEAMLVGLVSWWLAGRSRVAWAVGTGALLFPPFFVVAFSLMPYGNHTEFLWMPVLLLGLCRDRGSWKRLVALFAVSAIAVLLYRLNLAAVVAFAGSVALAYGRHGLSRAGILLLGATVGVGLVGVVGAETPTRGSYLPALAFRPEELLTSFRSLAVQSWPGVAGGTMSRVLVGLSAALIFVTAGVQFRRQSPALRFPVLAISTWAALAAIGPLISAAPRPEYLLNAWYAVLLLGLCLLAHSEPRGRWILGAALCGPLAIGILPGLQAAATGGPTASYDGVALYRSLSLETIDADDLPHWNTMMSSPRAHKSAGMVTQIGPCARQFARELHFVPRDVRDSRCGECASEGMVDVVKSRISLDSDFRPGTLGAALWVRCNRDMDQVHLVTRQLDPQLSELLRAGAQAEAQFQAAGASTPR